jgi:hypothetical protein
LHIGKNPINDSNRTRHTKIMLSQIQDYRWPEMRLQNGPTDHRSLTMGLRTIKKAKRSSQKKYNEGRRRLAPNQFRLNKQTYEIVSKICELYKFWKIVIGKERNLQRS